MLKLMRYSLANSATVSGSSSHDNEISNFLPEMVEKQLTLKPTLKDVISQIITSCIVHCIVIQAGVNMAYSTVLVHGLQLSNENTKLNRDQESWIASLVTISLPIGSLFTGLLMDKFGRKTICLLSCVPAIISWILLITSKSIMVIYVARIVAGIAAGLSTVGLVYVSEISHPEVRPMLLCLNSVFVSFGILLTCCLGIWLDWRKMAMVFVTLDCCIFFVLLLVPESPYWLICFENGMLNEKRLKRAEKSLHRLNQRKIIYEAEYARIKETYQTRIINQKPTKTTLETIKLFCKELALPRAFKPLALLFFLFLLQQLSGTYVVIFYAISVFREIKESFGSNINEYGALVMLGVIRFIMSLLTAIISRKCGRRILCISSGIGMTFSMFFSGMFLYLTSSCDENGIMKETMANQKWLLLVIVLFYVCMSSIGLVVVPWTLIGELLPISIRGVGGGLMVSLAYIIMFGTIKCYPYALNAMGVQGIFFFFSFMSLIATSFVYLFLPETLGKTFAEIESYFVSNKAKSRVNLNTL